MKIFVLGGARSGKSFFAQKTAQDYINKAPDKNLQVTLIVTAKTNYDGKIDEEMMARINKHKKERPDSWQVIEAGVDLASAVNNAPVNAVIIIDCLTLWLGQFYATANSQKREEQINLQAEKFYDAIKNSKNSIIVVSNEIGWGVVPISSETRDYRDRLGIIHQKTASVCENVFLITAGIPLQIK